MIVSLLTFSCTEEKKGMEASAIGFVRLINEDGKEQYDRTGIQIKTTDGSSSAITNKIGKFVLNGLKIGKNYDLEISKEGYGNKKLYNYLFLNGPKSNLISYQSLYLRPIFKILGDTLTYRDNVVTYDADLTLTKFLNVQIFINDSIEVSNTHFDFNTAPYTVVSNSGISHIHLYYNFASTDYKSGTTAYIVIYFNNKSEYSYYDQDLQKFIYSSAVKASEIMTFKIP